MFASTPWLELRGTLDEPVRDVRDVAFSLYPDAQVVIGTARPAAVGSIIHVRPCVSVVLKLPFADFDRLWSLTLAGQCKHAHISLTEPRYGRALVTNASFSNQSEE